MPLRLAEALRATDEELFEFLGAELDRRVPSRNDEDYLGVLCLLPRGLRAMAATYELDVSLTLDDLGWHFGNWHDLERAEETAKGLEELGARELAAIFRRATDLAQRWWDDLGSDGWMDWYHGSEFEREIDPLNKRALEILEGKPSGIFSYWVEYARRHPENLGVPPDA